MALQAVLNEHTATLKAVPGVTSVKRIVCGGCQDFKIITAVGADEFASFEVLIKSLNEHRLTFADTFPTF